MNLEKLQLQLRVSLQGVGSLVRLQGSLKGFSSVKKPLRIEKDRKTRKKFQTTRTEKRLPFQTINKNGLERV
jgi:hypothetical protein